ncbi:MAG: hypothetical protein K8J08_20370 [Thermoanaerobaculia bacterium]|nr:hypothetical protein [Thermoanaerobaculia bacterium]
MSKRNEPVRKSIKDSYADLTSGHQTAALDGPDSALRYLDRTLASQHSLPNAVKCFAYDFLAAATAELGQWERCADAVDTALQHLEAAETDLPVQLGESLPTMAIWERGIAARLELGDFESALELCDDAVTRRLGPHFEAKRDSLSWAR